MSTLVIRQGGKKGRQLAPVQVSCSTDPLRTGYKVSYYFRVTHGKDVYLASVRDGNRLRKGASLMPSPRNRRS